MNCPKCLNKTIRFADWKKARNAFNWTCPHCGAELKANKIVIVPFLIALALVLIVVFACLEYLPDDVISSRGMRKICAVAGAIVVSAPLAALSWFKGGYIEK